MNEEVVRREVTVGDKRLVIETGRMAKQADGAVFITYGGTALLVTAVASKEPVEEDEFFPLTVDYRERAYAIGRIPGVYGRREPRPGVGETLIARLVDHCIRPLFPKEFRHEVQVIALTLSCDQENPPETMAVIGASAALCISDIPFNGPVAAVTVGRINGQFIINPTYQQLDESDIELFVTGDKNAIMSVEGGADQVPEDEIIEAIKFAHEHITPIIELQEELIQTCGRPKRPIEPREKDEEVVSKAKDLALARVRGVIGLAKKEERREHVEEIVEDVITELIGEIQVEDRDPTDYAKDVAEVISELEKQEMRRSILEEGKRIDGRAPDELRPITAEVGVLPRTHGSALFTRGQTQSLCTVTLGTSADEEVVKDLEGEWMKHFILHYNFPPFCTGEVKPIRGPSRREIGHGALAERALEPVIPSREEFPYTIRVVSEILESNASSSMATVCSATLALMDAGVPIKGPVAGVGVGLIKEDDREVILVDMVGEEDFLGDMDFKVAGTRQGVTALQMDIKIEGITIETMRRAIHKAREARIIILDKMAQVIAKPRPDISPYAPRIFTMKIHPTKIREVIGPGGSVVRKIQEEADVLISIHEDGVVEIAAVNSESAEKAKKMINDIAAIPEVGKVYSGKVTRTTSFGAFVEILPGQEGLIHISELADGYVRRVEDVVREGDTVKVKVINVDEYGKVDLTLLNKQPVRRGRRSDRPSRGDRDRSRKSPRVPRVRY